MMVKSESAHGLIVFLANQSGWIEIQETQARKVLMYCQ